MNTKSNLFCNCSDIKNEADVEAVFVERLLKTLGYPDKAILRKRSLSTISVGKGSKKENYKPDYVCLCEKKPKIVIDAKNPHENLDSFTYQVSGYALGLNKKFKGENPVRFTILTDGHVFKLYKWDEEEQILTLTFSDFSKGNKKFKELCDLISSESIKRNSGKDELSVATFLKRPSVEEIKSAFNKCHRIIWKKDKLSPTDAFYEFSKIIFVKLSEDKRIRQIIADKKRLSSKEFKFSVNWLQDREAETENPLSSILFAELQKKLQEQIERKQKKPIFVEDEGIELKSPTIKEVVKVLQNYDFYTIDEDLNGRMFETFLNATIRGRELGQYFTPRKIVKFMTKLANLSVEKVNGKYQTDKILDACCGSGGFLIDAMADLIEKVKNNPSLKPYKDEILEKIKLDSIYGIEANPKISRIARMNMYAHGDGGSRIYCADSLDKNITIIKGTNKSIKKELEELRTILIDQDMKFDIVLTNPPFSMSYSSKEKDEKAVMEQYADEDEKNNLTYEKGTHKLKTSVKSNVLFIARYVDFLRTGGRLFIILDNSVLNSSSHREYRNYIRNNFIIKAIFQLPTHAFVNQEAGGITSILYLEKRKNLTQEQSPIFARHITKVGHGISGKEKLEDDFTDILKEHEQYEKTGRLFLCGEKEISSFENDDLFLISPEKISDRLDIYFHQPSYYKHLANLRKKENEGKCELKKLADFTLVKNIDENLVGDSKTDEKVYKYIEISSIDKERGCIIQDGWEEGLRDQLPNRAKLLIKQNDVLFSKPFRSLQKVAIVPKKLDGHLASSGFVGIRPRNYDEACLLWSIIRSELVQKQLYHLASGYTQRELNDEYLNEYLLIPLPKATEKLSEMISECIEKARKARSQELEAINKMLFEPVEAIK